MLFKSVTKQRCSRGHRFICWQVFRLVFTYAPYSVMKFGGERYLKCGGSVVLYVEGPIPGRHTQVLLNTRDALKREWKEVARVSLVVQELCSTAFWTGVHLHLLTQFATFWISEREIHKDRLSLRKSSLQPSLPSTGTHPSVWWQSRTGHRNTQSCWLYTLIWRDAVLIGDAVCWGEDLFTSCSQAHFCNCGE